jgi:hypothetical protein
MLQLLHNDITTSVFEDKTMFLVKDVLDVINDTKIHLSHIKGVMEANSTEFVRIEKKLFVTRYGLLVLIKYLRTEQANEVFFQLMNGELTIPE